MSRTLLKVTIAVVGVGIVVMSILVLLWFNSITNLILGAKADKYETYLAHTVANPTVQIKTQFLEPTQFEYLGEFKLTFYCPCEKCCGKTDGITATGTRATAGRTIAVDPKVIPYGSEVMIRGHKYIAEDCGGAIKNNRIDVYVDSHEEALQLGVQYADVYLLKD